MKFSVAAPALVLATAVVAVPHAPKFYGNTQNSTIIDPARKGGPSPPFYNTTGNSNSGGTAVGPTTDQPTDNGGSQQSYGGEGSYSSCVSQQEAQEFVDRFISVVTHVDSDLGSDEDTANAIIADRFTQVSNSVLALQGFPLNGDGVVAESRQEWVQGVLHAPPFGGVETTKVLVACDQVLWYWTFTQIGTGQYPVKGFNLFTVARDESNPKSLRASRLELEFDSLAWALDTGFHATYRNGTEIPTEPLPSSAQSGQQ